jgi:hypothetical protein
VTRASGPPGEVTPCRHFGRSGHRPVRAPVTRNRRESNADSEACPGSPEWRRVQAPRAARAAQCARRWPAEEPKEHAKRRDENTRVPDMISPAHQGGTSTIRPGRAHRLPSLRPARRSHPSACRESALAGVLPWRRSWDGAGRRAESMQTLHRRRIVGRRGGVEGQRGGKEVLRQRIRLQLRRAVRKLVRVYDSIVRMGKVGRSGRGDGDQRTSSLHPLHRPLHDPRRRLDLGPR